MVEILLFLLGDAAMDELVLLQLTLFGVVASVRGDEVGAELLVSVEENCPQLGGRFAIDDGLHRHALNAAARLGGQIQQLTRWIPENSLGAVFDQRTQPLEVELASARTKESKKWIK